MVAHIDVDQERELCSTRRSSRDLPSAASVPILFRAGAFIVSGIEINTGGGAGVAAPTDKQQPQAKRGLGTVTAPRRRPFWRCNLTPLLPCRQITYYVDARDGSDARRLHHSAVLPYGQVKDSETQAVYDLTSWMTWRRQVPQCAVCVLLAAAAQPSQPLQPLQPLRRTLSPDCSCHTAAG
jgi:hypothetical protein